MADHDDLTDRLAALGSAPVPGPVRDGHVHAMRAATSPASPERRFGRLAVAAAAVVGFVVGSTGFAVAGALPDPAQGVAHDVLAIVQVDVPDRPQNRGACVSAAARAGDHDAKAACKAIDPPGRDADAPGRSGEAPAKGPKPADHPNGDGDPCTGKPPWAGKGGDKSAEARAAHRVECPNRDADDDPAAEAEEQRREAAEDAADDEAERGADAPEEAEERGAEAPELPDAAPDGGPTDEVPADAAPEVEPAG